MASLEESMRKRLDAIEEERRKEKEENERLEKARLMSKISKLEEQVELLKWYR